MVISSLVIFLAAGLFVMQSEYYTYVLERNRTQENARSVADLVAGDMGALAVGSVVTADSARFVARMPLAVGAVCDVQGSTHSIYVPDGQDALTGGTISGFGVLDADGDWRYTSADWSTLYRGGGDPAGVCAEEGADTLGAAAHFLRMDDLSNLSGTMLSKGDPVLLYSTIEFRFQASALDPSTYALYRGVQGDDLVEFATGMASDAHFSYRTGDTTHVSQVTGAARDSVDGVRIHAHATDVGGNVNVDVDFELDAAFRFRNAR